MQYIIVSLFVLVSFVGYSAAGNIPDYIHICHRSDPQIAKCIRESIEVLRPKLKAGIPEINVPGLEPFRIPEIVIRRGDDNNNFRAILKNINVLGAGDFEITKLKMDIDKMIYRVGVKIPVLHLKGEYDMNVRILVAPVTGSGTFYANATNCDGQAVIQAEVVDKKLRFKSINFLIKIDDYFVHLDNLFNGDKVLSQAANQLLNQNKEEFLPIATPFIARKTSEILLEMANKITENFDYDEVFPE